MCARACVRAYADAWVRAEVRAVRTCVTRVRAWMRAYVRTCVHPCLRVRASVRPCVRARVRARAHHARVSARARACVRVRARVRECAACICACVRACVLVSWFGARVRATLHASEPAQCTPPMYSFRHGLPPRPLFPSPSSSFPRIAIPPRLVLVLVLSRSSPASHHLLRSTTHPIGSLPLSVISSWSAQT